MSFQSHQDTCNYPQGPKTYVMYNLNDGIGTGELAWLIVVVPAYPVVIELMLWSSDVGLWRTFRSQEP